MEQKEFFKKVERFAENFNRCVFSYLEYDKKTFPLETFLHADNKLSLDGIEYHKRCKELGIKWDPFVIIPDSDEETIHVRMNMFSFITILLQIKEVIDKIVLENCEIHEKSLIIPIESEYLKNFYDPDSRDIINFMSELYRHGDACIIPWIISCAYEKETTSYKRKRWSLSIGEDYDKTSFISMLANTHIEFAIGGKDNN